jgi:hypothetical protein
MNFGFGRTMASGTRFISANIAVVVLALLACKGASVEGKYSLDKADTKAQMQPDRRCPRASARWRLGIAFVDLLDMTISSRRVALVVQTKVPNIRPASPRRTEQGTWTHNDALVTIVSGGDTLCVRSPTESSAARKEEQDDRLSSRDRA